MPRTNLSVSIRPIVAADAQLLSEWMKEAVPDNLKSYLGDNRLKSRDTWEYMAESGRDKIFIVSVDDTPVGISALHSIDLHLGTAISSTVIFSDEYRSRGVGRESKNLQLRYAFENLSLNKIYADVLDEYNPLINALRQIGYKDADQQRANGTLRLSLDRSDWKSST